MVEVFDQGQVEIIRLSPGETSPSDKASISVLSSCYKTNWPTAVGGVIGTIHSKDGNLRNRGVTREFGFWRCWYSYRICGEELWHFCAFCIKKKRSHLKHVDPLALGCTY